MVTNLLKSNVLSHSHDVVVIHIVNDGNEFLALNHSDVELIIDKLSVIKCVIVSVVKMDCGDIYIKLKTEVIKESIVNLINDIELNLKIRVLKAKQHNIKADEHLAISLKDCDGRVKLSEIKSALDKDEIVIFSQPIIDLKKGKPVGIEVLCRWQHPEFGLLLPFQFFGAITEFNLSLELDIYMLKQACKLLKKWEKSVVTENLSVSVNVNANSLSDSKFTDYILGLVEHFRIDRKLLMIEITETGYIYQGSAAHKNINILQSLGILISLDDFGSGTTILGYLTYLTPNEIKVDKGLINAVFNAKKPEKKMVATKMLNSIIDWVDLMEGVQLVVEGIESKNQAEFLKQRNVNIGQGYLFGKPLPIDLFEENLMNRGIN